jgi:hypothetical protein
MYLPMPYLTELSVTQTTQRLTYSYYFGSRVALPRGPTKYIFSPKDGNRTKFLNIVILIKEVPTMIKHYAIKVYEK